MYKLQQIQQTNQVSKIEVLMKYFESFGNVFFHTFDMNAQFICYFPVGEPFDPAQLKNLLTLWGQIVHNGFHFNAQLLFNEA
jgi:hypothetical protein